MTPREKTKPQPSAGDAAQPLEVSALRKSFGPQKVLKGVDLSARAGETVVVLGRSGTGKSVLLKLIVGLQKPDSGSHPNPGPGDRPAWTWTRLNEIRKKDRFPVSTSGVV